MLLRVSANPRRHSSSDGDSRGRLNPLIGNLPPLQQEHPTETPPWPVAPARSPDPSNADLPPPPPPPPRADAAPASPSWTLDPGSFPSGHAYNAVSSGKMARLDLDNIIGAKAGEFAAENALTITNPMSQPKVHTKAVSGRTVFIKSRMSPTSAPNPVVALRVLDKMCRDQKIKQKYHSQKFHERKGLRKKRLKSSRWRARFKTGFQATVSRVLELKRQGW
ncbi:ribosomal protein [Hirsutella rhossiliensis]|uniref:Ribosomal protein s21 domain-containing protein n=1 Tax=Hirsutella rhossiliensis TaxID=111463 RepID=A0A9P8SHK8_9HYPO|nr:ribosomal protein s21 domain-containing protein [Hirsutella rhossiliensis]KAH0961131.1 ribosomal protein s21 domain-containing protein [Hirsutella rhossiliensis]